LSSSFKIDLHFSIFESELKLALKAHPTLKQDLKTVFDRLENEPRAGDAIPRVGAAGSVFKIRLGVKGLFGKRGGYRLLYHVDFDRKVITPVALYFKKDTPNLPDHVVVQRFVAVTKYISESPEAPPN
jgi:mRNA-degrading endonuclease RelE of RelBE toxin-antitoxin system